MVPQPEDELLLSLFWHIPKKGYKKGLESLLLKIGVLSVVTNLQELTSFKQLEAFHVPPSFSLLQFSPNAFVLYEEHM